MVDVKGALCGWAFEYNEMEDLEISQSLGNGNEDIDVCPESLSS